MINEDRYCLDEFELYNVARAFCRRVYQPIHQLPSEEKYCLEKQMRCAAVSVTNNIAEGHGRWQYQENIHFCRTSGGSLKELIDDLNVCLDERFGDQRFAAELKDEAYSLIARINGYTAYLKRSKQGVSP